MDWIESSSRESKYRNEGFKHELVLSWDIYIYFPFIELDNLVE
jgi:hypothetical protein